MHVTAIRASDGGDSLHSACRADEMSDHRLGGGDRDALRAFTKDGLDRERLHRIVLGCAGPVRVDCVDVLWREASIEERA